MLKIPMFLFPCPQSVGNSAIEAGRKQYQNEYPGYLNRYSEDVVR